MSKFYIFLFRYFFKAENSAKDVEEGNENIMQTDFGNEVDGDYDDEHGIDCKIVEEEQRKIAKAEVIRSLSVVYQWG